MGLRINQNIAAMNSYRNLSNTDNQLSKSLEKLSSGFRINRAADDAAGLAISEGLRAQVGGLKVATRNSQDGISVVQTAEGALNESHSILQRMRDLSVQASNDGGLNSDAKGAIQSELGQLKSELTRIADTTTFNGKKLLDSNYNGTFQVGANAGETISVKIGTAMGASGLGIAGLDVTATTAAGARTGTNTTLASHNGTTGTAAVTNVSGGNYGLSETFDGLSGTVTVNGKSLDLSTVKYATGASASDKMTTLNAALTSAGVAATASAGGTTTLTLTGVAPANNSVATVAAGQVGFTSATGASAAITAIDAAIKTVSNTRGDLGALQNRFEHTVNNLNVTVENLSASESRIRDADMAQEMMQFTRNQILSQAGTSMLAQANQGSQGVLSLLR
jgi:flagellin